MKRIFEPHAPPIQARIHALKALYTSGIRTYVFIGPLLPMNPEAFSEKISPYVHAILIDRMNYVSKTLRIYKLLDLSRWLDKGFIDGMIQRLRKGFAGKDVRIC